MSKPRLNISHESFNVLLSYGDKNYEKLHSYMVGEIGYSLVKKILAEMNNVIEAKIGSFNDEDNSTLLKIRSDIFKKYGVPWNHNGTTFMKNGDMITKNGDLISREIIDKCCDEANNVLCPIRDEMRTKYLNKFGSQEYRKKILINIIKKYADLYEDEKEAKLYDLMK